MKWLCHSPSVNQGSQVRSRASPVRRVGLYTEVPSPYDLSCWWDVKPQSTNQPGVNLPVCKYTPVCICVRMRHLLTPSKICTAEYIYTRVFLAHANWTLVNNLLDGWKSHSTQESQVTTALSVGPQFPVLVGHWSSDDSPP